MSENKEADFRYEETYGRLWEIYHMIFHDLLKERALNIGLTVPEWDKLSKVGNWDEYTDFFEKMHHELWNRKRNNYLDASDLLNPSTVNLESQITEEIIKKEYIHYIVYYGNKSPDPINWYMKFNIKELYDLYKNDKIRKTVKEEYPIEQIKESINFDYDEKILIDTYNEFISNFSGNYKIDNMLDMALEMKVSFTFANDEFYPLLLKNYNNKEKLFSIIKEYSGMFCDWMGYFICYDEQGENKNNLELLFLKIFQDYKNEIIEDKELLNIYVDYLTFKMRFSFSRSRGFFSEEYQKGKEYQNGIFESFWVDKDLIEYKREHYKTLSDKDEDYYEYSQLFITKEKLNEFIENVPEGVEHETLLIYKLIYLDILDRTDRENYIKELIYRMRKISDDNSILVEGLKKYLDALLKTTFFRDVHGEKKPLYFDEISGDLKEIFGEEEFSKFESIFKKGIALSNGEGKDRSKYSIGLIFGDKRSKKAFDMFCNDKRNDKEFIDRKISKKQFNILSEERYDQQDLDIENKLKKGKLSFVLIFEFDHETKLRNLIPLYPDRMIVCNVPKQHFSHTQFLNMLDLGLDNFEK